MPSCFDGYMVKNNGNITGVFVYYRVEPRTIHLRGTTEAVVGLPTLTMMTGATRRKERGTNLEVFPSF